MHNRIITGSFCEFRGNHFHTGIDISTFATIGMPVYAPNNGYISYIKQDFLGYGNTIFLQSDSLIYVFGHLNSFSDKINKVLNTNKYRQKLFLTKDKIKIKKGEIIAYSGNSGTYIPHLHFEIRSIYNHPLNPLDYYIINDKYYPEIQSIIFEPADDSSLINGKHEIFQIKTHKIENGKYATPIVDIYGTFYISVKIVDKINSASAKLFIKKIDIFANNNKLFSFSNDSVSFNISKFSPLFFRQDLQIKNNHYTFYPHININNFFYNKPLRKLISSIDTIIKITVNDNAHNQSIISIKIRHNKDISELSDRVKMTRINNKICLILSGKYAQKLKTDNFTLHENTNKYSYYIYNKKHNLELNLKIKDKRIKSNIFYANDIGISIDDNIKIVSKNPIYFISEKNKAKKKGLIFHSDIYKFYFLNKYMKRPIKLIIKNNAKHSLYSYINKKFSFIKKLKNNDTLTFHTLQAFVIAKDIQKPKYKFISKKKIDNIYKYKFKIFDSLSGIDWIFVSDSNSIYNIPRPQSNTLIIKTKKEHFNFTIKDREGNKTKISI